MLVRERGGGGFWGARWPFLRSKGWVDFLNPGLRCPSPSFNLHPELAPSKQGPPICSILSDLHNTMALFYKAQNPQLEVQGFALRL